MSRSRVQLATAYAPDRLFTWEGGRGICRSVPLESPLGASLAPATQAMILEGVREAVKTWRERAWPAVPPGGQAHIELILDDVFYEARSGEPRVDGPRDFAFTSPERIGYLPWPLLYQCGACKVLREFHSVGHQAGAGLPRMCGDHVARWAQVDVVYAHWSGGLEPLSPFRYRYNEATQEVDRLERCTCSSRDFRLDNGSPVFANWTFTCLGCRERRQLRQPDPHTLRVLKPAMDAGAPNQWLEINMLPVSYRANGAFYPQRGYFIELPAHPEVLELMAPDRRPELGSRLAQLHRFAYREPPREVVEAAVRASACADDWTEYEMYEGLALTLEGRGRGQDAREFRSRMRTMRDHWVEQGIIQQGELSSPSLNAALTARTEWARRYDPIRLTLEHAAFVEEHIDAKLSAGLAVDLRNPDPDLCAAANDPTRLRAYQAQLDRRLQDVGLERMVLIRGLPICEYSFGYTRVSAEPIYHRNHGGRDHAVPVRLKAFSPLPDGKRPIYVLQQNNEALYVRLDPRRVAAWLERNGVTDVPPPDGLPAAYLERYEDFGPFLEEFRGHEGGAAAARRLPPLVYMLLHTLSHQFVHALAELSGLERSAIGEHLFPADLAFVVYRKGMTPDLGNLAAMWRNYGDEFLQRLADPRLLRCGSGSLCDHRGGACPSCIMLPDVTCIASNQLMSRAVLRGGPPPTWEPAGGVPYVGYFDPALTDT